MDPILPAGVRCSICRRPAELALPEDDAVPWMEHSFLCHRCDEFFFRNLYDFQKGAAVRHGRELAREHNLPIGMAINVSLNRYSLAEALRRSRLKEREANGASLDAYDLGKRLPGSFATRRR